MTDPSIRTVRPWLTRAPLNLCPHRKRVVREFVRKACSLKDRTPRLEGHLKRCGGCAAECKYVGRLLKHLAPMFDRFWAPPRPRRVDRRGGNR